MVEETSQYQCTACDKTATVAEGEPVPTCCGHEMKQLPLEMCTEPATAEWSRPMEDEEPCDDFRGGQ